MKATLFAASFAVAVAAGSMMGHTDDWAIHMGRSVTVENLTGEVIFSLYAVSSVGRYYPADLLGNDVIPPGERRRFDVDDNTTSCNFELKVVTKSERVILASANVCGAGAIWSVR